MNLGLKDPAPVGQLIEQPIEQPRASHAPPCKGRPEEFAVDRGVGKGL